jgi:hypothetical protein
MEVKSERQPIALEHSCVKEGNTNSETQRYSQMREVLEHWHVLSPCMLTGVNVHI